MSEYDDVHVAASNLFTRFWKAVAGAVATGTAAVGVSLEADGNYKTAAIAGVLAFLGGFGFVALSPSNK